MIVVLDRFNWYSLSLHLSLLPAWNQGAMPGVQQPFSGHEHKSLHAKEEIRKLEGARFFHNSLG